MKKRLLSMCLVVAMSLSLLTGCGAAGNSDSSEEKVLNIGISTMPQYIDAADNSDVAIRVVNAFYERLYTVDSKREVHGLLLNHVWQKMMD